MKTLIAGAALMLVLSGAWAAPALPKDVASFLERRAACDHWRGEEPYDEERRADIERGVCKACTGTDAQLAALKRKYRKDRKVLEQLQDLEEQIEPSDKAEARSLCKTAEAARRTQ